jgi:hypothetical protein
LKLKKATLSDLESLQIIGKQFTENMRRDRNTQEGAFAGF